MATKQDRAILNCVFSPLLPFTDCSNDEIVPEELKDPEYNDIEDSEVKSLEIEAIRAAENCDLKKSIALFSQAISQSPTRPSVYNNRAQAYRLAGDTEGALRDLDSAIRVSNGNGRSACLAYCQKGLILRLEDKEDQAKEVYQKAAKMGSRFAATQLVQMNSYAALCNDMLTKVLAMQKNTVSK